MILVKKKSMTEEKEKIRISENGLLFENWEEIVSSHGFCKDRWGNYKSKSGLRRLKRKSRVLRYEVNAGGNHWVRIFSFKLPKKKR